MQCTHTSIISVPLQSPLHIAAEVNDYKSTRFFLENGTDPNRRNEWGLTPLHLAIGNNNIKIVKTLLQCVNLDPNRRDEWGLTPLQLAIGNSQPAIVHALLQYGVSLEEDQPQEKTCLLRAISVGNNLLVSMLLEYGADPNHTDQSGLSPLHLAITNKNTTVINMLLERRADPNQTNQLGLASLHLAAQRGDVQIIKILLQRSTIDLKQKTTSGLTALDLATQLNNQAAMFFLSLKMTQGSHSTPPPMRTDQRTQESFYCQRWDSPLWYGQSGPKQ